MSISLRNSLPAILVSTEREKPGLLAAGSRQPTDLVFARKSSQEDARSEDVYDRRELQRQIKIVISSCAAMERNISSAEDTIDACLAAWAEKLREMRNCDIQAEELDRKIGLARTRLNADVTTAVQAARESLTDGQGRLEHGLEKLHKAVTGITELRAGLADLKQVATVQSSDREHKRKATQSTALWTCSMAIPLIALLLALLGSLPFQNR